MSSKNIIPSLDSILGGPVQVSSKSWENHQIIKQSDVNLFCWTRDYDQSISSYIYEAVINNVSEINVKVETASIEDILITASNQWNSIISTSNTSGNDFWNDILFLTTDFLKLTEKPGCNLHLGIVDDETCTQFHIDQFDYKLFCTYYGSGIEWLPEKAVNREGLGKSNELIIKDSSEIQKMETFEVGILKGDKSQHTPATKGIVYRSPSIESNNMKRLVFRLD
ncbi:DUF1826 domain-containing protein [Reichenbachiella versicolor]|uniref:DUF1826 domain-containing protein n=1 Tax=Reichenbachiella versicolor TaxID=1821036 RepID=UPI000D6E97C9|nr:DUF1826 domain-containing protein [Reichenbachiella versicolor]